MRNKKDIKDKKTINDWGFNRKWGSARVMGRFRNEDSYYRDQRMRIFEFTFESVYRLKQLIMNKFGRDYVDYIPNEKLDSEDQDFYEYYKVKSPDLYIEINAELDLKPYWGVIYIIIGEKNDFDSIKFENEIDQVLSDFPWNLDEDFRSIFRPRPCFYKDWFKIEKKGVFEYGLQWVFFIAIFYFLLYEAYFWLTSFFILLVLFPGILLMREFNLAPLNDIKPPKRNLYISILGMILIPIIVVFVTQYLITFSLVINLEIIFISVVFMVIFGLIPIIFGYKMAIKTRTHRLDFLIGMPISYRYAIDPDNPDIYAI